MMFWYSENGNAYGFGNYYNEDGVVSLKFSDGITSMPTNVSVIRDVIYHCLTQYLYKHG